MPHAATLPQLLHTFFHDWLIAQRNTSRHTVLAYRDTWRLLLRFVAARLQRPVAHLELAHLTATEVLAFLTYLEQERHVSIATRNCRLAALRSFFAFVADREPLAAAQCAAVLRIPTKRSPRREVCYLDVGRVPIFPVRLRAAPGVKWPYVSTGSTALPCSTSARARWPRHWRDTRICSALSSAG
jgi:site-specific recombinase XerC